MSASTSAKVHIHMHVSDLAKSREFYRKFFGVAPVKDKPGYVKFLPELGPVNLALTPGRPAGVGADAGAAEEAECARRCSDHLGIQVDSPAAVQGHLTRVKAAGLPVRVEMGVNCCHANQDKFWVQDPDGVEWEIYHLNYDLEDTASGEERRQAGASQAGLPLTQVAACCSGA